MVQSVSEHKGVYNFIILCRFTISFNIVVSLFFLYLKVDVGFLRKNFNQSHGCYVKLLDKEFASKFFLILWWKLESRMSNNSNF